MGRAAQIALGVGALALILCTEASAYPWPLRPFSQPHAVRSYFNDPRIWGSKRSFHFGVDICAEDSTPVYAVEAGEAFVRGHSVMVESLGGESFSYWHIVPAVSSGRWVVQHQMIGHVAPGYGHVHFAERRGMFVNPLRPGALAPYIDHTVPSVPALTFYSSGQPVQLTRHGGYVVAGVVDVTVDAYDLPPSPLPPAPWAQTHLAPALIRWRIMHAQRAVSRWHTAVDFRTTLVPPSHFNLVYGPGTFTSRAHRPGRYEFYLARELNTATLPDGVYLIDVEALDLQKNLGKGAFAFTVMNVTPRRGTQSVLG